MSDELTKEKLETEIKVLREVRSRSGQAYVKPDIKYKQVGKKLRLKTVYSSDTN